MHGQTNETPEDLGSWKQQFAAGNYLDFQAFYQASLGLIRSDEPPKIVAEWVDAGYQAAQRMEDSLYQAEFAKFQGLLEKRAGNYPEAIKWFEEGILLAEGQEALVQLKIAQNLANTLRDNNQAAQALEIRRDILQKAQSAGLPSAYMASFLGAMAQDFSALGQGDSCLATAYKGIEAGEASGIPEMEIKMIIEGAARATEFRYFMAGYEMLQKLENLDTPVPSSLEQIFYSAWGNVYYGMDSLEKAAEAWRYALQIAEGYSKDELLLETNLISVEYAAGGENRALMRFDQLLDKMDLEGMPPWKDQNILQIMTSFLSQNEEMRDVLYQHADELRENMRVYREEFTDTYAPQVLKPSSLAKHTLYQILDLQAHEATIRQAENADLVIRNRTLFGVLGIFLIGLVASFIVAYQARRAKTLKTLEYEARETTNRMVLVDLVKGHEIEQQAALNTQYQQLTQEVGHEIHDGLGAVLAVAQYALGEWESANLQEGEALPPEAQKAKAALNHAQSETRLLSHQLKKGLSESADTLRKRLTDFAQYLNMVQSRLTFSLDADVLQTVQLGREESMQVYRVIQELVQNTLKHAQANRIELFVAREEGELIFFLEDDGKGFDLDQVRQSNQGIGLEGIENRLKRVGGSIEFDTQPGAGTSIWFKLPVSG